MFISVPAAVERLRQGQMVLICDDSDRENEADLCLAAQFVTPEHINFIAHAACGLICVALSGTRLDALHIPLLEHKHQPLQSTAFTHSVDARTNTTTGISAHDRATTIRALVNPTTEPTDLAQPGHVFPLRARPGGVLERRGHTEASVDLMHIAGLSPGAVICEVLDEHGEAARGDALFALAKQWQIPIVTVESIVQFRQQHAISLVARTKLPTQHALFTLLNYHELATGKQYLVLQHGEPRDTATQAPLVRLHSACATGDIFGSQRCDCQAQLHTSLELIAQEDFGLLIYLPQEGRDIGLTAKLQAYALQDDGHNTISANEALGYPVDARTYTTAIAILQELGISHVRLLTNNPRKMTALTEADIIVEHIPLVTTPTPDNSHYLHTKQTQLGHMLPPLEEALVTNHSTQERKSCAN